MDKKQLRTLFSKYGTIKDIRLVERSHSSFAYIEFQTPESAQKSLELNQKKIEKDRILGVAISNPSKTKLIEIDPREIYIYNISNSICSEEDLSGIFDKFGKIQSIRIPKYASGVSKGTAFISFEMEVCFFFIKMNFNFICFE